jgi:hypothetical protein
MEERKGVIQINYTDETINQLLKGRSANEKRYTYHFNQNEQFFLDLEDDFIVPHFPIHHNVYNKKPSSEYKTLLQGLLEQLVPLAPKVFQDLTYFFDPSEILRPCFFQLFKTAESYILFLLRLDLLFKTHECEIVERGTNDTTPKYRTKHMFVEGDLIPLESVYARDGRVEGFKIKQTISQTWIGETGRGYFVQGIWMDSELTKFFSKLFLPWGKRIYPYYPFVCKFKTICRSLVDLSPEARKSSIPQLTKAVEFITPAIEQIQESLRENEFSEKMETFVTLKEKVPSYWQNYFDSLTIKRYLNEQDMKEFEVAF